MHGAFRVDLLDPNTGLKTGNFPILTVTELARQRALDRIGKWSFPVSITDPGLVDIEGSDFEVFWLYNGQTYNLGQCSYLDHQIDAMRMVQVQASGRLRDLQRQTVLQRSFDGATDDVNDVLSTIVPLRSGWALGQVDTITTAAPMDFWYETIFDSVALLAATFGYHFREGINSKTLDFGAMGEDSGLVAVGGDNRELAPEIYHNPDIVQISELSVSYQSSAVVNRLIPFGGAVGVATINLSETTSTQSGYPVLSANLPDSTLYYYLEDAESVNLYGLTEQRFLRKDLRPISNTPAAREFAANVLYEATLASLLNLKDRQTVYEMNVTGWQPGRVRVGDQIQVKYRGYANTWVGDQIWLDLDQSFYVLEINETFSNGVTASLKINENAVHEQTVEDLLASTIRAFEQAQIHVQPTISRYTVGPYVKRISTSVSPDFSFDLGPETLDIWYVKIKITGEPLKSSIESVAGQSTTTPAGGGATSGASSEDTTASKRHTHTINVFGIGTAGQAVFFDGTILRTASLSGETLTDEEFPAHRHNMKHTHLAPNHQHTFTPNIDTQYGIFQDTQRPDQLTIKVNGATVASGVTLGAANNYTYELDISSQILAAATLQQEHTVTVEAGSGQGEIQFQAQVLAVIQGIAVS